jgi:hypothetical protein
MDVQPLKDAFWAIVTDCLERFHDFTPSAAMAESRALRAAIESPTLADAPPPGYDGDLIFHGEPFYVACDIAGRELRLDEHRTEYQVLLLRRYGAAEQRLVHDLVLPPQFARL